MKSIQNRNNKYKSKPNLQLAFSGISRFQIGCLFAEYDLSKPTATVPLSILYQGLTNP